MTAEDLLTRTFDEITETSSYPTTAMSTVVARAHELRRRRRRRVAALAAAAAVVVAAGLSATALLGHTDDSPAAPAGPLGRIEQGPAPKVDYLNRDTFVPATGDPVTSPAFAKAQTAAQSGDGVLAATAHGRLSLVTDGKATDLGCGASSFAVPSGGGEPVYWRKSSCAVMSKGSLVQGGRHFGPTQREALVPVGLTTGGVAVTAGQVISLDGQPPVPLRLGFPRAATGAGGLVAGQARDFQRSAVVDASTGAVVWRTGPAWILDRFSSSGTYVAGVQTVGVQPSTMGDFLGIWDAGSDHQVLRKELPGLIIDSVAWEGDDYVLVVAEDPQGREAILRVGLDGSVVRTTPVVSGKPQPAEGRGPLPTLRFAATP